MIALKKRAFNLLSGKRVREIRKQLGLTIENANKVFGGGAVAFSKYENDDLCQSELMDKLIVGAEKFPEFYDYLLNRAGIIASRTDVSIAKSETRPMVFVSEASDSFYNPKLYRKVSEGVKRVG
jgi:HTH-type transcriptional regulator/antitoxin MqsA